MIVYERPVRFEEVDAAGIVFFGRYVTYAHEAMEHFFGGLEGGYPHLIRKRKIGLPAVDLHFRFVRPASFGDRIDIETRTLRLGNRSAVLGYRMSTGGELVAEAEHTVVTTDLSEMKSIDMPEDVRRIFAQHLSPATTTKGDADG